MQVIREPFEGVLEIQPRVFQDERGFFLETFHELKLRELGIDYSFVQDNHSRSMKGVLRGLHFQTQHPQGKLVYVPRGEVFDVVVDIRKESKTYGQWYGTILNEQNHKFLFIPPGLAHGFCVISDWADFLYKCTDFYHPEDESGIIWNDLEIGIQWPVQNPTVSLKDSRLPRFMAYANI